MRRILLKAGKGALTAAAAGAAALLGLAFLPTLFGYEALIVTSGSMGKSIPVGSVAITQMVDVKSISVGDIVSFRYPGSKTATTHRVISVAEEDGQRVFATKGDANQSADPEPVRLASGRIALVKRVVPYAGTLVRTARSPAGGVAMFVIPILGLTFEGRRRKGRPRSARRRRPSDLRLAGWSVSTLMLSLGIHGAGSEDARPAPDREWSAEPARPMRLAAPLRPILIGRLERPAAPAALGRCFVVSAGGGYRAFDPTP